MKCWKRRWQINIRIRANIFSAFSERYLDLKSDRTLCEMIRSVYSFLRSLPFYLDWLNQKTDQFTASLPLWQKVILEEAETKIRQCLKNYETALDLVYHNVDFQKYEVTLSAERAACERLIDALPNGWDKVCEAFDSLAFRSFYPIRTQDAQTKETIKSLRDEAKNLLNSMKSEFFFRKEEEIRQDLAAMEPCIRGLCETITAYDRNLMEAKKKKNSYEFSDLEHFALRLFSKEEGGRITPSAYAEEFSKSCTEILIDEYQDTQRTAGDDFFSAVRTEQPFLCRRSEAEYLQIPSRKPLYFSGEEIVLFDRPDRG